MNGPEQNSSKLQPSGTWNGVLHAFILSLLCAISYWLITHLLARLMSVSREDDALGGMWSVVATIFVYRNSRDTTFRAALSRTLATVFSFILCFTYLLFFPFSLLGMVSLIGLGAVVMSALERPDEIITAAITTAVVMVVAALSPHPAWREPIYRLVDTIIGIGVGVLGILLTPNTRSGNLPANTSDFEGAHERV